jgi:hypothetical protein
VERRSAAPESMMLPRFEEVGRRQLDESSAEMLRRAHV